MIDFVKKHLYVSENENRNETTKPHMDIIGATGSLIQDTLEENKELKVQLNHNEGVIDDNITEILKVLKEHGNDITNLRIQQGYISSKYFP